MGCSGEQTRVHHCPSKLPIFCLCRAVSSTPALPFMPPMSGQSPGSKDSGQLGRVCPLEYVFSLFPS